MNQQVFATQQLEPLIKAAQPAFEHSRLDFTAEQTFACQQLMKNSLSTKIAKSNPTSVKLAIQNLAAIGVTLNPAEKMAYLLPRNGEIVYDISYRGMLDVATRSGAIVWAKVELVYEADTFVYKGADTEPVFECDPFTPPQQRGALKGGFIKYKLPSGDKLVTVMRMDEIVQARNTSASWKSYQSGNSKSCVWIDWWEEMVKKTIIKRAWKLWVGTGDNSKIASVDQYLNHDLREGIIEHDDGQQADTAYISECEAIAEQLTEKAKEQQLPFSAISNYVRDRYRKTTRPEQADDVLAIIEKKLMV